MPREAAPVGALLVPQWHEDAVASVLPQPYQDPLEVAADARRPLRAAEFCTATGLAGKAQVEGVRSRLRRLAARGWLPGRIRGEIVKRRTVTGPSSYVRRR